MNSDKRLADIFLISNLILESRLANVRAAAKSVSDTEACIEALDQPEVDFDEIGKIASAVSKLHYRRWADMRHFELNLALATQKAALLEASSEARLAFGRKNAFGKLLF